MNNVLKLAACLSVGALLGQLALGANPATPAPGRTASVPLAPDAPSSYVVVRGDTLWGISSKFLTQPWYWPEIWYLNPEIKNPHRIYPGDTLRLDYDAAGRPQIRVERGDAVHLSPQMRATPLDQAIPAIPYEIVAAFMSKPSVITKDEAKTLPYVAAMRDSRVVGGTGDEVYVRGIGGVEVGTTLNIVHLGERIVDPDGGGFLGYQGVYAGAGRVERGTSSDDGDALAKLMIVTSARETLPGDRLIRDPLEVPLDFVPHAPSKPTAGRIISVIDGVNIIGQYQVIVVNRGKAAGLEPGHVLAIWQRGEKVAEYGTRVFGDDANSQFSHHLSLPEERAGTFMVFKAYDDLSYGLVMSADHAVHVGDVVRNP
jgi:hypothetical protein